MIAFDNGPPNGDYVRYIDGLMARAADAASAGTLRASDGSDGAMAAIRRLALGPGSGDVSAGMAVPRDVTASTVHGEAARSQAWFPTPAAAARSTGAVSTRTTGFATPVAATPAATAAEAIASALMSGQVGRSGQLADAAKISLAMLALGLTLLIVGVLWSPLGPLGIVAGVALMFAAVRRLRPSTGRAGADRTTGSS